jgi:hypothetical protein
MKKIVKIRPVKFNPSHGWRNQLITGPQGSCNGDRESFKEPSDNKITTAQYCLPTTDITSYVIGSP